MGGISVVPPAGWRRDPLEPTAVWRSPGRDPARPAIALATSDRVASEVAIALRDDLARLAQGFRLLEDDSVPLGGRIWRRLRLRFAIGPLACEQAAWIGTVGERTLIAVASAGDGSLGPALPLVERSLASAAIAERQAGP